MNELSIEKQLTHRCFCDALENIEDIEQLKYQISQLHLLYLKQQAMFAQMAKDGIY